MQVEDLLLDIRDELLEAARQIPIDDFSGAPADEGRVCVAERRPDVGFESRNLSLSHR